MMFKKYFTPPEAEQLLPKVKQIVGEILSKGQSIRKMVQVSPSGQLPAEAYQLGEEIKTRMAQLEEMGCFFKDWNFDIGLVDFPSIIDDEEVLLCWRSDEYDIGWYHSVEDGFAGRKPLPIEWLIR